MLFSFQKCNFTVTMKKVVVLSLVLFAAYIVKVSGDGSIRNSSFENVSQTAVSNPSVNSGVFSEYDKKETASSNTQSGITVIAKMNSSSQILLKRTGFTESYNTVNRIPNWVGWNLTSAHTSGAYKRSGVKFHEDFDLPESVRSDNWDYYNSGYDRGHMCPAGDNKWSEDAMSDCFLFSNMCPQTRNLNAGDWNELEQKCRKWADEYGSIYIVCGPILYNQRHKSIGSHHVVVPEAFYKVVLRLGKHPEAIGFILKNVKANNPLSSYVNSVDQVERITGIDFFPSLPDAVENKVEREENYDAWDN